MTYVEGNKARKIMEEVQTGSYGNLSGVRSLAVKIKCHSYYWPTMVKDFEKFAHKFEKCQGHTTTEVLSSVTAPNPFTRWEMDIIGPWQKSKQKCFLLILTDFSQSRWKQTHTLASKTHKSKTSYGKISSADMESHTKS